MNLTQKKCWVVILGMMLSCSVIASEVSIGLYFGKIFAMPGDVKVGRKDGSHEVFHDVTWKDRSFELPFYYSLRVLYWPNTDSDTGLALDFTHAKLYSSLRSPVTVSRVKADGVQQTQEILGDSFSRLAFSHGYNYITLNALYRSSTEGDDSLSDTSAYLGAGFGIAVPHVEIQFADTKIDNYKPVGLVFQGMAGITFGSGTDVPLNAEYKLSSGDAAITLSDDARIELSPLLHHLSVGPILK